MELKFDCYPKINIGLYIGKKEADGYHSLISLFQKISNFKDIVTVSYEEDTKSSIEVTGLENYVCPEKSTVYKAAQVWLERTGKEAKIKISVEKGIPDRSGMGGGSSDAGAVLLALNRFTGNKLSQKELSYLAFKVGSDVPFFVYDCDAAIVSGKGDVVNPIESRNDLEFNIFFSDKEKCSTKIAYDELDKRPFAIKLPTSCDLVYEYRENPKYWAFTNDFAYLYNCPVSGAFLTGAGNAWYTVKIAN